MFAAFIVVNLELYIYKHKMFLENNLFERSYQGKTFFYFVFIIIKPKIHLSEYDISCCLALLPPSND